MIFGCLDQQNTYLMELLLSNYAISDILDASFETPDSLATLVWVWHADKIPPHIGISSEDKYFSLKANGKDDGMSVDTVIELINKKSITSLCFQLKNKSNLKAIIDVYDSFSVTKPNETTCLNPIKEILNLNHAQKLTELLDALYAQEEISKVFGYHLPENFKGIQIYSTEDIHERLRKLLND